MPSLSKIKLKSFVFALVLSFILTAIIYFLFSSEYSMSLDTFVQLTILFSLVLLVSFILTYVYLKLFIENKIKEIYKSIIPQKKISSNKLISTNMEDLVNQLKTYSIESQTEIKSMQEKENFRRNFIGNLAHELKTPLFNSQSYLLTLIDGALKDDKINLKYLKIAEKAVERLIFIVKDLDLITKLESDNMNLEKSNFNLISIINNVFEMLEIQAKKKGGFVHFLLGNHEYMVFQNDLRYIHSKYHKTPFLLGIEYKELYGKNTVIGRWLRSKSTIIKINDIIFTHGGISKEFFSSVDFDLEKINKDMRESIDLSIDEMVSNIPTPKAKQSKLIPMVLLLMQSINSVTTGGAILITLFCQAPIQSLGLIHLASSNSV